MPLIIRTKAHGVEKIRFLNVKVSGILSYHWTLNGSCSWTFSQLYLCEYPIIWLLGSVVVRLVVHVFCKGVRLSAESLSLTCLRRGPFRHYGGRKSMHFAWKRDRVILNVKIFLAMALYNFVCSDYSPHWWLWMQVFGQSAHEYENFILGLRNCLTALKKYIYKTRYMLNVTWLWSLTDNKHCTERHEGYSDFVFRREVITALDEKTYVLFNKYNLHGVFERPEILTEVNIKVLVFCDVTRCSGTDVPILERNLLSPSVRQTNGTLIPPSRWRQ